MINNNDINLIVPNILVVDDTPANLRLLCEILDNKGFRVREVPNGNLALKVAEKEKPDLILLDIMMPDMDGFEVCRLIKENQNLKDVPIIFISALNDTIDIVKAFKVGAADYITKPFRAEEVKARVTTHLKLYQQRRELHEQSTRLQKINAEKDKLFSIISHDLRGPFNGFLGLTNVLTEKLADLTKEETLKIAESMQNTATNLYRLIGNLLEWSQSQRGLIKFVPVPFLLIPFIVENMIQVLDSANNKSIGIKYEIPANLEVFADGHMLASILRNLASNAVKFTHSGGIVTISAKSEPDNSVEIIISDTGIGMSSNMIEDLFRLDVQSNRLGTQGEPSTGLGLILCKDFAEKHGGRLWVESETDKGSVFHVSLPGNSGISV
jgi:two-component system, sensor histidine kinase and response regulator